MVCLMSQEGQGTALAPVSWPYLESGWAISQLPRCLEPSVRAVVCWPIFYVIFVTFIFCIVRGISDDSKLDISPPTPFSSFQVRALIKQ
jgi:hypothetical protein